MIESTIGGKVSTMQTIVGVLEAKKGLGFDGQSFYYLESPEDKVLRLVAKRDTTGSCIISLNISGLDVKKGIHIPFNPSWLRALLDGAIQTDEFRLQLGANEASLSFSSSRGMGFRKPYSIPNELDINAFFEKLKIVNEHFEYQYKQSRFNVIMPSLRHNLKRCSKIHADHLALVSYNGNLYTYVRTKDEGLFVDSVGVVDQSGGYDVHIPITSTIFNPLFDRFEKLEIGIPKSVGKVRMLFVHATKAISDHEFMDLSMMIGKNREYNPKIDDIIGDIDAGIHRRQRNL